MMNYPMASSSRLVLNYSYFFSYLMGSSVSLGLHSKMDELRAGIEVGNRPNWTNFRDNLGTYQVSTSI